MLGTIFRGVVLLLFCTGISSTRFGHEPNAYGTPNLIPYESSEMLITPSSHPALGVWNSRNINSVIINNPEVCYSGNTCLMTVNRTERASLRYRVSYNQLEAGYTYLFNVFIKFTNSRHKLVEIRAASSSKYNSSFTDKKSRIKLYTRRAHKVEDLWLFYSMDLKVTPTDKQQFVYVDFYLRVDDFTDFILDAASLVKVDNRDWKAKAIRNIARYRMGSISFRLNIPSGMDRSKIRLQVNQTRRHFPFGVAVTASIIGGNDSDPVVQRYRAWVEKRVTWAVFRNAAKWKFMEGARRDETEAKFEIADKAYTWLHSKNIKVRGHTIHWSTLKNTPKWVAESSNKTAEINRRTNYVVRHYKGKFQHWDVVNEHGGRSRVYQNWLGREDVLEYIHNHVRTLDPNVKLFMNQFGNLHKQNRFSDTVNNILRLKKKHLVDGVGLQAHFVTRGNKLDMEIIKRRLEIITGLGIPVWITEMTINNNNPEIRGRILADCLTLFYGTPGVHGIVHWDFAPTKNPKMLPTALATPDIENTAAGDKYDETLAGWTTNVMLTPSINNSNLMTSVFFGTYNISVFYDGDMVASLPDTKLTPDKNPLQVNLCLDN